MSSCNGVSQKPTGQAGAQKWSSLPLENKFLPLPSLQGLLASSLSHLHLKLPKPLWNTDHSHSSFTKKPSENLLAGFDTVWLSNGSAYMGLPEAWFLNLISISNNLYFLALHLPESNSLHLLLASSLPVIPEMSSKYHCDVEKESIYSAPELFLSFHPQPHF